MSTVYALVCGCPPLTGPDQTVQDLRAQGPNLRSRKELLTCSDEDCFGCKGSFTNFSLKRGVTEVAPTCAVQAAGQTGHRACRGDHLLAPSPPAGRWSGGRRESDHFFGAGPRALLFPSLLHQQTHTNRKKMVETGAQRRLLLGGIKAHLHICKASQRPLP